MKKSLLISGISIILMICFVSTISIIFNYKKVTSYETILDDEYYNNLLAIEDASRNKDCLHVEFGKIPVLKYVDILYKKGRIDEEEKNIMLRSYGYMDENMGNSIDNMMHIIFKCDQD